MIAKTTGNERAMNPAAAPFAFSREDIVQRTLSTAAEFGLTTGTKDRRLSVRAHDQLVDAAAARTGLQGSDLVEYALAKVALEDDFAPRLLARQGTIDRDIDLGI